MRTARDWGDPPLIHFGIRNRTGPAVLMVKRALRIYEDSLCSCGHSSLLSHGAEGVGEYEDGTITCHACKAMESVKAEGKPGQKRYARDLHDDPRDDDEDEGG